MKLECDWRYYLTTVSLLLLLLLSLAFLISCTANESPLPASPANDNTTIPVNATPAVLLDIKSFQAQPKTIKNGETTTLAWNVTGASSLSIEPVTGSVSANTGSVSIAPKETTLYTLKVSDGRLETTAKFLVIVKTADGSIIWPKSGSDNATTEQLYEGWTYYPNKYVEWKITDHYRDPYGDTSNCWHLGYITNMHSEWMMTEVTVGATGAPPQVITSDIFNMNSSTPNNRVVLDGILPGSKSGYTTSMDCLQLPELKWKWKAYR
jgi:hypothetical protein